MGLGGYRYRKGLLEDRDLVLPHVLREYIGKMYWVRWSRNFRVTEVNKTKTTTKNQKPKTTNKKNKKGYPNLDLMLASRGRNMSSYN